MGIIDKAGACVALAGMLLLSGSARRPRIAVGRGEAALLRGVAALEQEYKWQLQRNEVRHGDAT